MSYTNYKNLLIMVYGYWSGSVTQELDETAFHRLMGSQGFVVVEAKSQHPNESSSINHVFWLVGSASDAGVGKQGELQKMFLKAPLEARKKASKFWIISQTDPKRITKDNVQFEWIPLYCMHLETPKGPHCALSGQKPFGSAVEAKEHPLKTIIMSADEISKLGQSLRLTNDQFVKIPYTDPLSIWFGAKIGDILMTERPSDLAGKVINYYQVINVSL